MRGLINYMDTRSNNEDFALTPYLFLVKYFGDFKIIGIGICWGYWAISFSLGINVPKGVPTIMRLPLIKK